LDFLAVIPSSSALIYPHYSCKILNPFHPFYSLITGLFDAIFFNEFNIALPSDLSKAAELARIIGKEAFDKI